MKLEKLNTKDKAYKFFLYGLIYVVVLLLIFNFVTSKAKYRVTQSIPLVRGTITSSMYDFHIVGIYLKTSSGDITGKDGTKYKETDEIPGNNYKINETNSYCYIGTEDNIDTEAKLYTNSKGEHILSNLTKKDNCYLYFDGGSNGAASDTIIADKEIKPETDKMFNVPDSTTTTGVLYQAEDNDGTSYYYRGNPTDNWVYFGGYYWRIIRINGDGTIRMIYQGTTAAATGETTNAVSSIAYNKSYNDNIYVGYWYGTSGQLRGLTTPSNIYTTLNDWFAESNIKQGSSYYQYIDPNAGFCNDREPSTTQTPTVSNVVNVGNGSGGTGTTTTYYGANLRLLPGGSVPTSTSTAVTPSLKCSNSDDLFTYSGANKGNKKLANPVGLITADEVAFGGLVYATTPSSRTNYLDTGQYYWTMSPSWFGSSYNYTYVFRVDSSGYLNYGTVSGTAPGVRPVINLKADVELTGDGTTSSPYKIKEKLPDIIADREVLERTRENKDFNVLFTEDTTGKIYKSEDNDGTSYYFAGNPSDNWVYFGGYYWRIIRINGDGTIRMIYQGTTAAATGETTQIGTSAFNSGYNNNRFVGYWYGNDGELRGLTNPSNIYAELNKWFAGSNIKQGSQYYQYIDPNAGFCNDRTPSTTYNPTVSNGVNVGDGNGGTGTTKTYYGAYLRLLPGGSAVTSTSTAVTPTLKCSNSDDLFTYSGANQGNKKLENPVGLITADETAFGGLVFGGSKVTANYLYTGQHYWTMSPCDATNAQVFIVNLGGYLYVGGVSSTWGVRPVINLKANTLNSGDGTVSSPFQIL